MASLRSGSATDTGRLRDQNEDALLVTDTLFVVADGMGGHAAGEVAAQITVDTLRDSDSDTRDGIVEAVKSANRAILERSDADPETRGMGTTVSAVALVHDGDAGDEMVLVANVGDSRVYRVHRGELEQLSEDHSLVEDLVRAGRISPAEARTHPNRNIVTRVLGTDADVEVDSWLVTPETGDRYLLCSDGLSDEVEDPVIARTLLTVKDPDEAANRLVEQANAAGGRDNITVIVVDVVDDDGRATAASDALRKDPPRTTSTAMREGGDVSPDAHTTLPPTGVVSVVREDARAPKPRRITWRVVVFVFAVLAVFAAAVVGIFWFARNTYYVGVDGDDVVIYRGRPGGVLWIEPTEEEDPDLTLDDIQPSRREEVESGHEVSSLAAARRYVENITTTTTTTTSTTTTTTTTTSTTAAPFGTPPSTTTP